MMQSQFSAADSALGYLYQVRLALLWSLRRLKTDNGFIVSIETLDDVAFESKEGSPDQLLQLKHHRSRKAALTDASPDLWKTLRIWIEETTEGVISQDTALHLLTTAEAPEGSVAACLRAENRDVEQAVAGLVAIAQSSGSKSNCQAYKAFLATPPAERRALVERVIVLDASPSIDDLDGDIYAEVFYTVEKSYLASFLSRLEGWWYRRVLQQLTSSTTGERILAAEIESQINDLREQFGPQSLPVDGDLSELIPDEEMLDASAGAVFVQQLEIIAAGRRRVFAAIRDYYRAFEQRSRWLREDLLLVGDLSKYERRLTEEWELVFAQHIDELGEEAAESVKQSTARSILRWAETASLPIRPHVTEPFVVRGSLHMLADEVRLGWHPDFRSRLAAVLEASEVAQ